MTVNYPTGERDKKGSAYWHCRCQCGNEVDLTEDMLIHGGYTSCGCKKEACSRAIHNQLHFVDGTCVEWLKSRKNRSDNTSGFRGVSLRSNGNYRVQIGFRGERYLFGTYSTKEKAIKVRLKAEEVLHDAFVDGYYKWLNIA